MISADWIRDLHRLKRMPRAGWFRAGIVHPESVADHSFAAALLAWRLARELPGLDAAKVLLMMLLHDVHEARLTDIPDPSKAYLSREAIEAAEVRIQREQWGEDREVRILLTELRAGESEEAKLVRAVDHLEFLLQAEAYRDAGHPLTEKMLRRGPEGPAFEHPATRKVAEELLGEVLSVEGAGTLAPHTPRWKSNCPRAVP
jgi:putative hydrolase of HD superfamily